MEENYSSVLKKLTKKQSPVIMQTAIILMILVLTVIGIIIFRAENEFVNKSTDSLQEFTSALDVGYSKLTPMYLSEPFASNYDDTILSCLAVDEDYNTYIVSIKDDDFEKYQDLINYTYNESIMDIPAEVTFEGTSQLINKDLKDLAMNGYNIFWGMDPLQKVDSSFLLGNYYLDTTQKRAINYGPLAIPIIGVIFLIVIYINILNKSKKINEQTEMMIGKFQSRLNLIDEELITPQNSFVNKKLYFTETYIICGSFGFDIIPYEDIEHVYGLNIGHKKNRIIAVTLDGVNHVIAELITNKNGDTLHSQIIQQIQLLLPDIKYGFEDGSFSVAYRNDGLEVDVLSDFKESNLLLGIIGSILGAALGGVLWIVIGKLGFIAGIAGSIMMIFSIKGYRRFSGLLDKKGKILSIVITFVMILVAQYMLYALLYCEYNFSGNYSIQNILSSVKNTSNFLSLTESWGSFLRDLAVGYGLSIWAGFGIIKSTFSNK